MSVECCAVDNDAATMPQKRFAKSKAFIVGCSGLKQGQ